MNSVKVELRVHKHLDGDGHRAIGQTEMLRLKCRAEHRSNGNVLRQIALLIFSEMRSASTSEHTVNSRV